jgi:hypothetical protein
VVADVTLHRTGVRQAKAAVAEGEGELVGQGAVCAGIGRDGEDAVQRLALNALHGRADVLPPASSGQVCHPLL